MKFSMLHHADQHTIDEMYNEYSPIFILSTGRSGSKFLATLLDCSPNISAFHEPRPTLEYFSNYAFQHPEEEKVLEKIIDTARMESILDVFIKDKIYVESNQCLTFFAPSVANLFKQAKFIHVVRHPGDFVRGAIRKGWYNNDSIWESGRIKMAEKEQWQRMDQIKKLSWLWHTTNKFITQFSLRIEPHRTRFYRIEDLFREKEKVNDLVRCIGGNDISQEKIIQLQNMRINELEIGPNEPPNMKKTADYPNYQEWNDEMKIKLHEFCGESAEQYGYLL